MFIFFYKREHSCKILIRNVFIGPGEGGKADARKAARETSIGNHGERTCREKATGIWREVEEHGRRDSEATGGIKWGTRDDSSPGRTAKTITGY